MKLVKCKGCNAPIGKLSTNIREFVRAAYDDKTALKQSSIESAPKQLCKECYEKAKA